MYEQTKRPRLSPRPPSSALPFPFSNKDLLVHLLTFMPTSAAILGLGCASATCHAAVQAAITSLDCETFPPCADLATRFPMLTQLQVVFLELALHTQALTQPQLTNRLQSLVVIHMRELPGSSFPATFLSSSWPNLTTLDVPRIKELLARAEGIPDNKSLASVEILGANVARFENTSLSSIARTINAGNLPNLKQVRFSHDAEQIIIRTQQEEEDLLCILTAAQQQQKVRLRLDVNAGLGDAVMTGEIFSNLR